MAVPTRVIPNVGGGDGVPTMACSCLRVLGEGGERPAPQEEDFWTGQAMGNPAGRRVKWLGGLVLSLSKNPYARVHV